MIVGDKYAIKHTTRSARALVKDIQYELDVNTLHRSPVAGPLALNSIGRVILRTTQPLMVDPYRRNRQGWIVHPDRRDHQPHRRRRHHHRALSPEASAQPKFSASLRSMYPRSRVLEVCIVYGR